MKLNFVIYSQIQFCAVFELHSVFLGLLVTEACFLVGKKGKRMVGLILNLSGSKLFFKQQKFKVLGYGFIPRYLFFFFPMQSYLQLPFHTPESCTA